MTRRLPVLLSALLAIAPALHAASVDPYEALATKLGERAAKKLVDKKVAVLPFDYIDGRTSPGGRIVAEKLTNRFVEIGELSVIERSMVEKVVKELEFQNSSTINPETARSLGKGLGVEAIVTGTLEETRRGQVEISARVIKTESYEIVAAGTQVVSKTWQDGPAPSASAPEQSGESSVEAAPERPVSSSSRARRLNIKGFADFVLGVSNSKMDLEFKNGTRGINQSELSFGGITPNPFTSISFNGLTTKTSIPLGMRVGAYGQIIGGDMEISYFSHGMNSQSTSFSVNGINRGGFRFTADNYLKVTVLNLLTGDIFVRIPTSETVFPYLGLGMGMTLNTVTSSYAKANSGGFVNSSLSETTPGFTFRIPFGVRFRLNDKVGMFGEGRYYYNTFTFNRNIAGETDSITMTGLQFLTGLSLVF